MVPCSPPSLLCIGGVNRGPCRKSRTASIAIARISGEAGYTTNYYRFFGAAEAPFDWYQSLLGQLASISTASVWLRLPATLAAIATWLIISRCLLPRLGRRVAAGAVWINCFGVFDPNLPFGGYKESGWGREMGQEGVEAFTEVKSVTVRL